MRFNLQAVLRAGLRDLPLSPYVRSIECHDFQSFDYAIGNIGEYVPLHIDRLGLVRGFVLTTDSPISVRLYSQMEGSIDLAADGLLVLWDTWLRTQTAPVVTILPAGQQAQISGIAIGEALEEPS